MLIFAIYVTPHVKYFLHNTTKIIICQQNLETNLKNAKNEEKSAKNIA